MNNELKQFIALELSDIASQSSQNKIARRAGVSSATISQMINNNWSLIAPEMWRKVQVNLKLNAEWNNAVINNQKIVIDLLGAVQSKSMSIGIAFKAGAGKSHSYKIYERTHKNVVYVECKNSWSKKSYVKALLQASGLDAEGTVEELIENFTAHLISLEKPIVIIDQTDKLKESCFDLFMDMYNDLDGHCGFVISGVPALEKKVKKGVLRDKVGYAETWSRINGKFIHLDDLLKSDVKAICEANYLDDQDYINELFNTCLGDLRSVKRGVQRYFLVAQAKKQTA